MLKPVDFHFKTNDITEDILRYVPGGYHPVIMGNVLRNPHKDGGPEYRVMHKLGYGASATVWLAEQSDTNAFVSVKVSRADCAPSQEAEMLKAATKSADAESNIIALLDAWTFDGPNGTHSVLVTDVVAPFWAFRAPRSPDWRKTAARGLARAVQQLHVAGIVHGDLHTGNAGVAVPQLAQQDAEDVMQDLTYPEVIIVLPKSADKQTASLPAYVVEPCNIAEYYARIKTDQPLQTLVFDFGSAHRNGEQANKFEIAAGICAPEVAFAFHEGCQNPSVDAAADIWALGLSIFELVADSPLFYGVGIRAIPSCAVELAGYVPTHWHAQRAALFLPSDVSPARAETYWAEKRKMLRPHCVDDADADRLVQLLKKILKLDSAARPSAADVLNDPWFAEPAQVNVSSEPWPDPPSPLSPPQTPLPGGSSDPRFPLPQWLREYTATVPRQRRAARTGA